MGFVTGDNDIRYSLSRDVSGLEMVPDAVARPASIEEVRELMKYVSGHGVSVTPAGSQTSTTGASITDRGVLLSMSRIAHIGRVDVEERTIRVGAGAIVADVNRAAEQAGLMFTPDPTSEEECTIGGAIACNASGARSLLYGATRPHVRALSVLLASGELLDIARPRLEKNTVGYPIAQDAVDWFIGSEGTLGIIVEAELSLQRLPEQVAGMAVPFNSEDDALSFVVAARRSDRVRPRCMEYFDHESMRISGMSLRTGGEKSLEGNQRVLVYVEEAGNAGDLSLESWLSLAESCKADVQDIDVYDSPASLRAARQMRHAVPATMNELGAARRPFGGRKVSTDWAVPYDRLAQALKMARQQADEAGIPRGIAYGHAGNGHPHQNIIADDARQLTLIEQVVEATLREVVSMGGTVAAEHGIGKLKRKWVPLQMNDAQIRIMRSIKRELDPAGLLSPGNIL